MRTWEYRVVAFESTRGTYHGIIEAYYGDSGDVELWSSPLDVHPEGETLEEFRADLELMLAACEKPVLKSADLP